MNSWISHMPNRCGGSACVRETRITVWGLVEFRRIGLTDAQILQNIIGLTPDDLIVAWDYAEKHPEEMERELWENAACMVESEDAIVKMIARGRTLGLSDEVIQNGFDPPLSEVNLANLERGQGRV